MKPNDTPGPDTCPTCNLTTEYLRKWKLVCRDPWHDSTAPTDEASPGPESRIEPIPGQLLKNAWEKYGRPMDSPEYLMMVKINELIAAHNRIGCGK